MAFFHAEDQDQRHEFRHVETRIPRISVGNRSTLSKKVLNFISDFQYRSFGAKTTPNICPHDQDLTRNFGHRTTFGTVDDPTLLVPVLLINVLVHTVQYCTGTGTRGFGILNDSKC